MKKLRACPVCGILFNRETADVVARDKDGDELWFDRVKCANEYLKKVE